MSKGITNQGDPTTEKCPQCGGTIVYNGNYFCENWTWYSDDRPVNKEEGECDWALPHPQELLIDKQISHRLTGAWEEETPDRWILHEEFPNGN